MPIFAINAEAQNSPQTFNIKNLISFMAMLRFPAKSLLIEPISPRTLCYITISMFLLSSKYSSSQGTFLGDQTDRAWRSFTGTVTEKGIMPVNPPVFCNQTTRAYCMLTMGWSGPSLGGCGCMLIYASSVLPNPFSVYLRPRSGI